MLDAIPEERLAAAREALDLRTMEALLDTWPTSHFEAPDVYPRWHFWLARAISMGYFLRTHDPALPPALTPPAPSAAAFH